MSFGSNELKVAATNLMKLVTQDLAVETAWLRALAHMENLAAQQIRTNISAFTPQDEHEEILSHAADEDRHSELILKMRPLAELPNRDYELLQERLCQIAEHFVVGYFGNPVLIEAKNKHAAYAHGAITIEQFPFQVYTAYLKASRLEAVLRDLPEVIRDEHRHLQLGRKLIDKLSEAERLPVERLLDIETDMCTRMLKRMTAVVEEFYAEIRTDEASSFEVEVSKQFPVTVAWVFTLGKAEAMAAQHMQKVYSYRGLEYPDEMIGHVEDELRHSKMLQRTVIIERRKLSRDARYLEMERGMLRAVRRYQLRLFSGIMKRTDDPETIYRFGAMALETRVFRHYKELLNETDHSGISHVLSCILEDETQHVMQVSAGMRGLAETGIEYKEIARMEQDIWDQCALEVTRLISRFVSGSTSESIDEVIDESGGGLTGKHPIKPGPQGHKELSLQL